MFDVANVSVLYDDGTSEGKLAVDKVSLTVEDGEFVSIIGPSGCGKSTLLHCMGGLLKPSNGTVSYDNTLVVDTSPEQYAFVFQDYSLFPWKKVLDNVAIGLRFAGVPRTERQTRAREQLQMVGLSEYADAYPAQLSGGMQQRVAVARALAMDPQVMLMDEPFGALDEQTRRQLGDSMAKVLTEMKKSVVMVTHSLDEAVFWSDRVYVLGRSPASVKLVLDVDEERPRRLSFISSPKFAALRARLFDELEGTASDGQGSPHAMAGGL